MNRIFRIVSIMAIIICFSLAAFQQSYKIGFEQIKIWDESSPAKNALEMLNSKSYFVVLNDGEPDHFHPKPPLTLWTVVLSYKLFGVNEFAVRFPTILATWLTMLIFIFFSVSYLKNYHIAWIILLIIASTKGYMFYHVARNGDPDTMLVFFVTCYFLIYFIILENVEKPNLVYFILFSLSIVGAAYTKGIAGFVPLTGPVIYTLLSKNGRKLICKPQIHISWITAVLIIIAYYILRNIYDPGYLKGVYENELVMFGTYYTTPKHPEFSYYINYLMTHGFKTYFFLLPVVIIPLLLSKNVGTKRLILYSLVCAVLFLLVHSMAVTKNAWYIAPLYPFLWLLLSVSLYENYKILIYRFETEESQLVISTLILICFLYLCLNLYVKIFSYNINSIKPGSSIYWPERPGLYLKRIKEKYPDIKNITCYMTYYSLKLEMRQLQFYAMKYHYENGIDVNIDKKLEENIFNEHVFTCEDKYITEIEMNYNYTLLDSIYYGKLYYILGPKHN